MTERSSSQTSLDFLAVLPKNAKLALPEYCSDSSKGERFFEGLKGEKIVNISVLRYDTFDAIAFVTEGRKSLVLIAKKNGFIAIEKRKGINKVGVEGTLAFRGDVSHARLDLAMSVFTGHDATYRDSTKITKNVTQIDPAADFVQMAFKDGPLQDGFVIDSVKPTWWTEDWVTIRKSNYESLVVRGDKTSILGAFVITGSEIRPLEFGEEKAIRGIDIQKPPQGIIPSRLLPRN